MPGWADMLAGSLFSLSKQSNVQKMANLRRELANAWVDMSAGFLFYLSKQLNVQKMYAKDGKSQEGMG